MAEADGGGHCLWKEGEKCNEDEMVGNYTGKWAAVPGPHHCESKESDTNAGEPNGLGNSSWGMTPLDLETGIRRMIRTIAL